MTRKYLLRGLVPVCFLALLTLSVAWQNRGTAVPRIEPFVRGYIALRVPQKGGFQPLATVSRRGRDIYLPRVKVHLLNLLDNSRSDAVTTDLSGRFTLPAPKPSRYRICWEAKGFGAGCAQEIVSVGKVPVHVSIVRIDPKLPRGTAIVFGSVKLSEGSSVRLLEPLADINVFGRVLLLDDKRKETYEALVNNFGDYVIPRVPVKAHVFLAARAEEGEGVQEIHPQANLAGAAFHEIDLTIDNAPPKVEPLIPRHTSGERVQVATPGETLAIKAAAQDPDGDEIKFRWLVDAGSGSLSSTDGEGVDWKLPKTEGLYSLTLIASDGKGGHARHSLSVRANTKGVVFSGRVVSTAGGPVVGADVAVNGRTTMTDTAGFFRLHVAAEERYVLNVRKPGFSLVSRIFDRGVTGGLYWLRRATVSTVDPKKDIDVRDKRSSRDCPGPASLRFDTKAFPGGVRPVWQDGKGNVIAPDKTEKGRIPSLARYRRQDGCGPGARVRIKANSLQDASGKAPAGPVRISLSTVDIMSPDQMPGDYTVALRNGGTRGMESYGAAIVEITSGGTKFNLRPGTTAEITIPVDPGQLAAGGTLPSTIPILFYDEVRGVWTEDTTATLQGNVYVAKVKHFSAINADVLKTDQACVRVDASDPGLPGGFRMQVIVPRGTAAPQVVDQPVDNSLVKEHVVYNLPTNTNITLAPYDSGTGIPFGTFVVNTGAPQNPTDPNKPFGPPYEACATTVVLTPQSLPEDPLSGEFLHGLLSFAATEIVEADVLNPGTLSGQLNQATINYYNQVDPDGTRQTLDGPNGFKTFHGFGAGGPGCTNLAAGETCAIYANSGDLGFGREMHCKKNGANAACYVTNFGNIDTLDSDDVSAAVAGDDPVATVAMEFAPIEGDPDGVPVVKFFVYVSNVRVNAANLDGKGARPIPQLCMVCHGGHYPGGPTTGVPPFNDVDEVKLGAEFLSFDLHNYTFAAAPFDKASQQDEFKTLNEDIVLATNPGPHTTLYIAEMHDGDNGVPPATQEELLVISDPAAPAVNDRWTAQASKQEMYKHVIGNACRTCHATNPVPELQFVNAKQAIDILGQIESRVCVQHVMPHAKRTHDLFWLSADQPGTPLIEPHQPGVLQAFGDVFAANGWQGNLCGVFTPAGDPVESAFDDVADIFNLHCTSCHLGGAPPGNLNLQAANAHAQLVGGGAGVNACERPVMKRVQPGSANGSFLFRKLEGSHAGLGGCNVGPCNPFGGEVGCGFQMPWTGAAVSSSPLTPADLALIEDWINVGAPN